MISTIRETHCSTPLQNIGTRSNKKLEFVFKSWEEPNRGQDLTLFRKKRINLLALILKMIEQLEKITSHFYSTLIKREIETQISQKLTDEEILILSHIGLPNDILDFQFTEDVHSLSESEIIIGKTISNNHLILDLKSRKIKRDDQLFISKSLKNLILQLYTYDRLWKIDITKQKLGNYRQDANHKKYAKFLETELLKIDQDILISDHGLWTSLIEDIEFGIVG